MEQITLTKQELAEIVQQEISKRLDGRKRISSGSILTKSRLSIQTLMKLIISLISQKI